MNVNWLWNPCTRHESSLSLLAAGVLHPDERADLEAHLAQCPGCREHLQTARKVAEQIRQLAGALPPVEPPSSLRSRWQQAVLAAAPAGPQASTIQDQPPVDGIFSWFTGRRVAWGTVCACWALIAFFRFSAPEAPRPATSAAAVSWQEVRLALERTRGSGNQPVAIRSQRRDVSSPIPTPSPRSQRSPKAQLV